MWTSIRLVLWILFLGSAILLSIVVLLQESKGGGLAEAFGGVGAETFGVKTRGINKFTFSLAGVFVGSAILLHMFWNA
ncbi:MAG TPA: preprotein translocase subunit SecG [Planctomycetota bacterium]|nr:preprotein translocase subunit SecG [Planctomycetota bacterium]